MGKDIEQIKEARREFFRGRTDRARVDVVGSGVSTTTRVSVDLVEVPDILSRLPGPWIENRELIVRLFGDILQSSRNCPGPDKPQCCEAADGVACFPNWVEREDPEWYALEIHKYLGLVDQRIKSDSSVSTALAADEAFELGCLLTEALIKFRWDVHAKRGLTTVRAAEHGGNMRRTANPRRKSVEETVVAVNELLAAGVRPMEAYRRVGKQQDVSTQTIGIEFRAANKVR